MKKKDEQKLEEMQQEIDEAEAAQEDAAEGSEEEAPEEAAAADAAMQEEIEALKGQVDGLNKDLQEKKDRLLRLQADFDNFRRRSAKEREEISAVVTQNFCKDMLPLLDNERAMAAETKDVEAFQKGVEMIFTQFQEILKKNGLEHIEAVGQKFDPNFHQAVMRVEDPEKEDDTVAQELQKGYMVKGRVIRPSMVQVVSN